MLHDTFTHPETRENETFLMNLSDDTFQTLTIPSKRRGTQLFDGLGNKIKWENKSPVFIDSNLDVWELRKELSQ